MPKLPNLKKTKIKDSHYVIRLVKLPHYYLIEGVGQLAFITTIRKRAPKFNFQTAEKMILGMRYPLSWTIMRVQ